MADKTDAVVASSLARDFATRLGFGPRAASQVALAASELASNCWRHAGGGRVEMRWRDGVLEVRAIDRGPGIPNVVFAFEDGVSDGRRHSPETKAASLGTGLGSVLRLMDDVQVYSYPSAGTTVIARKRLRGPAG